MKISATTPVTATKTKGAFGTKEWAPHNANCSKGCSNDCLYCYAKTMAIRFGRSSPETWHTETPYLDQALGMSRRRKPTKIMFPTTHDITPGILPTCIQAMDLMLSAGHDLLVVSKPHVQCIEAICDRFMNVKARILFRFTIGSADSSILKFWEPNAPDYHERLEALKLAHGAGYQTSVSCEPMLDDNVVAVVEAVEPFVTDAIWIGKANLLKARLRRNGVSDSAALARADALLASQCDEKIAALYERLRNHPQVKWKESIKKVVGIPLAEQVGQDV